MGYIRHHAIVVTSWSRERIEEVACTARDVGLEVLGPSTVVLNGYSSVLICPNGSKAGWEDSDKGDEKRTAFRAWLHTQGHAELEWFEASYGNDDGEVHIVDSAWPRDDQPYREVRLP